jgi:hypothetical protein
MSLSGGYYAHKRGSASRSPTAGRYSCGSSDGDEGTWT